ncbi:unnamed protein product [Amoebophrya sp. A25]|nr:unnamed protein product [Amoebophrya sp. A25]|eukprot:GSA25T00013927001.1
MTDHEKKYLKAVIKNQEMPVNMIEDIMQESVKIMQECRTERDIADRLKKHCDDAYTPSWNVIVGKTFGSYITHETKRYIQFNIAHMSFLVWKCG